MAMAALILSIVSFLMSGATLIIYLAKNVFSSHVVQMVPVDSFAGANAMKGKPIGDEFAEFDTLSSMDIAANQMAKKKAQQQPV